MQQDHYLWFLVITLLDTRTALNSEQKVRVRVRMIPHLHFRKSQQHWYNVFNTDTGYNTMMKRQIFNNSLDTVVNYKTQMFRIAVTDPKREI